MNALHKITIAFALTGGIVAAPSISTPTIAASDQLGSQFEAADASNIAPINLPDGAMRARNSEDFGKIEEGLKAAAKANHATINLVEVLIWNGQSAMKAVPAALQGAGYKYREMPEADSDAGKITSFAAIKEDDSSKLFGMWIKGKVGSLLLAWGIYQSGTGNDAESDGEESNVKAWNSTVDAKLAVKISHNGNTADFTGSWRWTTVSASGYANATTGLAMSPNGMSAQFVFLPDGRYKYYFYGHQRTYGFVTELMTSEEGTVTFNGNGVFTTHAQRGHYNCHSGSSVTDRPKTASELKAKTYSYEWRTEDGKRQLYIGTDASSMGLYKRDK